MWFYVFGDMGERFFEESCHLPRRASRAVIFVGLLSCLPDKFMDKRRVTLRGQFSDRRFRDIPKRRTACEANLPDLDLGPTFPSIRTE